MTHTTFTRWTRKTLTTALVTALALGSASPMLGQASESAPDLLTSVGGWEKAGSFASDAAVEGLAVEIRSDLLTRGQKRLGLQDFSGRTYEAELERIERPVAGATSWIGRVAEFGDHSQVLLSTYQGQVAGYFDTPEGRYEILPRPGGHVLVRLDASRFAGCDTEDDAAHDHPVSAEVFAQAARNLGVDPASVWQRAGKSIANLEIAVLFSETSSNAAGGIPGALITALNSVLTLDMALVTSGVNARATLSGWEIVSADDLGDSSGGGDGLVNTIYSNGSGLHKDNDQQWHQANPNLGDTANSGDAFGEVLAVGDFDGDGRDDLAIGIPGEDVDGLSDVGAVQILYGSSSRLSSTGTDFYHQDSPGVAGGNQSGDQFGFALAVGDFDGDGYDDLAIGKPFEDLGDDDDTGRVQVMYGSSSGVSTSGETTLDQDTLGYSNEDGDNFGRSLAAGDFDGDGYDDLAIGISEEDWSGDNNAGRVAVVYGASSGLTSSGNQLFDQDTSGVANSPEGGDRFGRSLAAGDFDDDGYDDLAIGAPYEDTSGKDNAGVIHILFGTGSGLTGTGSQYFNQGNVGGGTEKNDYFGHALAVGDINGDGYDDLVASAPWENSDDVGRTHLLYGSSTGLANSGMYITGGTGSGKLGLSLAVGDFDDDGYDDIAVGQPGADGSDTDGSGAVLIYSGSATLPAHDSTWTQASSGIEGAIEDDEEFGYALATGDFDGDGDTDLAVGVPGEGVSNDNDYFKSWLGASSITSTARATYSADLVGLIVEYLEDGSCGSAQTVLGSTDGNSTKYYQVTDRGCAVGNLTFAHEIGHLLGLGHDPANGGGACGDAHGHYVSGEGRTLMSYSNQCSNNNCTRVALISNPSVDFSFGDPSGISGQRDNARCANLSVGNVAAYN